MKKQYDIYSLLIFVAVASFFGFCLENLWLLLTNGYINNRNMVLPFLLGYGLALAAVYLCLGTPKQMRLFCKKEIRGSLLSRYLLYFFIVFLAVSIGEILLGSTVELICNFSYWNYSRLPLHITKYTSVPTSFVFSFLITSFMGLVFTPLMKLIQRIPRSIAKWIAITLMTLLIMDFFYSFFQMYHHQEVNPIWKKKIFNGFWPA